MKSKLILLISLTIFININAQIGFQENVILDQTDGVVFVKSIFSADLDGDGFKDVLSASSQDNKIAWYKNISGSGEFGKQNIIFNNAIEASFVYAKDIDGDGDIDVLSASFSNNTIAWYENMDGLGNFSDPKIITENANGAISVYAVDIDNDGDLDVLSASSEDNKIAWYENTNGLGVFGPQQIITTNTVSVKAIYPVDIDGDGDIDVISATSLDEIAWFENLNGQGDFGPKKVIATNIKSACTIFSADLDGDGDMDILSASYEYNGKLVWFENLDGQGAFSSYKYIAPIRAGVTVFAKDLDGDGDIDIIDSGLHGYKWYENTDGNANFVIKQELSSGSQATSHYIADLNNDNYPDIITGFQFYDILWYKNTDGNGTFDAPKIITKSVHVPVKLISGDLDGDGDLDIISLSSSNKTAWYENIDGNGTFGIQKIISNNPNDIDRDADNVLFNLDMDGDNDLDIVTVIAYTPYSKKLIWLENIDSKGDFSISHDIINSSDGIGEIDINDVDGDGDMDVISSYDGKLSWYQNIDGNGNFGVEQVIQENYYLYNINLSDIDGDGDNDVISSNSKEIWIHENLDGQGTFGQRLIVTNNDFIYKAISPKDIDGDGDMDIVCLNTIDELFWHENIDGIGNFGEARIISQRPRTSYKALEVKDIDGDGDMDVISDISSYGQINWFENIDGKGGFGTGQTISTNSKSTWTISISDIDNDGKLDVLSGSLESTNGFITYSKIAWHKNLGLTKNEIKGIIRLDTNANGCDEDDLIFPNLMVVSDNGSESLATFTLDNGFYQLFPEEGEFTTQITSTLPKYYSAIPNTHTSNFTGIGTTDNSDFCLTPNQTINDIVISVLPTSQARPGFDARYQLVFHNIGTTQLSGSIVLDFDDSKISFLTASETVSSQTYNSLTFNYTNLNPFETRTINLNLNVMVPPITEIGDILTFSATINPVSGDNTESDNVFELNQTVIGSYDPNDIQVLEGDQVLLEDADEYLHYIIRFQNKGTADAINIRVDNILDLNLDWDTMQLESSSHTNRVEIKNGNEISFIFNNIYLPDSNTDEPNSHGFIAYKIKPKSDVIVGDILPNKADIFFDFNPAIETNTVTTIITSTLSLSNNEFSNFQIFPNPTTDILNIKSKLPVSKVVIYNYLWQIVEYHVDKSTLDLSKLYTGLYFIKIEDSLGNSEIRKIIKK